MKTIELVKGLSEKFPEYIQESYDNTGTQVLFNEDSISRIYICLDADLKTVDDAAIKGCNLIISHHPLIFRPVKKIISTEVRSEVLMKLVSSRISLYSIHTNFDKFMYRALSEFLGYYDSSPLLKTEEVNNVSTGFGSIVNLKDEKKFSEILCDTKKKLFLDFLIYSGDDDRIIKSIAFINGSGGGSIEKVIAMHNPDCIITGDVGYHHIKYAIDSGVSIIDAGHYGTEFIFKKMLAESVEEVMLDKSIEIIISDVEQNPFKVYK